MDNQNSQKPSLNQLIEKIIDNGQLSLEDQKELNMSAVAGQREPNGAELLSSLTQLIQEGRVKVV
jgi:hypothetical protein